MAAADAPEPVKVFYSYVPQDQKLRDKLEEHLSALRREGKITTWHDGLIEPGMVRNQVRNDRIKTAELILLLISPAFMDSNVPWKEEVLQALERQEVGKARVIPIILRPIDWKNSLIGELQPLPKNGKPITTWDERDEAFNNVADGIRSVVGTLLAEKERSRDPNSPEKNAEGIMTSPSPSRNFPKTKLLQLIISLLLIVLIIIGSVIFFLVRPHSDNTHTIVTVNTSATVNANAHATATANTRATASVTNASSNANPTPIPFNTVDATFYTNPKNSGKVDFNAATQGVFLLSFPNIAFNPSSAMQHCNPPTTVNMNTRPFTDVVQNADGSCKTIQVKESGGNQAGVGNLYSFEAKFVAVIDLPSAGRLTTNISADDGWIFCMENKNLHEPKPTPDPHNIISNPPASHLCPGLGLPEMADHNGVSPPTQSTIVMSIPAAGSYMIELDYTECCNSPLTLVVSPFFMKTNNG